MPSSPTVQLPSGGTLHGFPTLVDQTPECSAATNLLSQLAPMLAVMHCQMKMLQLLKPLIDIVHALPGLSPQLSIQFARAAADLQPCLLGFTTVMQAPLARDILCLEIRQLTCLVDRIRTGGSAVDLASYAPTIGVLNLAGDVFAALGIHVPQPPTLSGKTDPPSLQADIRAIDAFVATLRTIAEPLGGC